MAPKFCDTVGEVLASTGMDPTALVLEVTEHSLIEDTERAMTVLTDLKELGIRVALDDFGTGYSSLSYLRWLPIDIVKIDQGFIADIGAAPEGLAIAAAVTNLAHVLGLTVIAEGVETAGAARGGRRDGLRLGAGLLLRTGDAGAGHRRPAGRTGERGTAPARQPQPGNYLSSCRAITSRWIWLVPS